MRNQKKYLDEGRYLVAMANIIGTDVWVVSAYERIDGDLVDSGFGTIFSPDDADVWYGKIGTNPDKGLFAHLPSRSRERWDAAMAAYEAKYREAYDLILAAFPLAMTAEGARKSMGEVTFIHKGG